MPSLPESGPTRMLHALLLDEALGLLERLLGRRVGAAVDELDRVPGHDGVLDALHRIGGSTGVAPRSMNGRREAGDGLPVERTERALAVREVTDLDRRARLRGRRPRRSSAGGSAGSAGGSAAGGSAGSAGGSAGGAASSSSPPQPAATADSARTSRASRSQSRRLPCPSGGCDSHPSPPSLSSMFG